MDGVSPQARAGRQPYAVAVMAKAPLPGTAKTRLVPALGEAGAARLHRAFLLDTVNLARRAGPADVHVVAPDEVQAGSLRLLLPQDITVLAQQSGGLMSGLEYALRSLLAAGYRAVALLDSDSPTLPPAHIAAAFAALESGSDVALGPCGDGGYYLLAAKQALPALFAAEYQSQTICQETARLARQLGLAVTMLPVWYDVDEPAELARLRRVLAQEKAAAPLTARELAATGLELAGESPNRAVTGTRYLHEDPWRRLRQDQVPTGRGGGSTYTYLEVPRAVWVVPLTIDGQVALVRQYRHPVRAWQWEVPAGSVEPGESSAQAALRELREEVGGSCGGLEFLGSFYSSAAHLDLRGDYYLAVGVAPVARERDEGEIAEVRCLPLAAVRELVRQGQINEGQSALALLLAEPRLRALFPEAE